MLPNPPTPVNTSTFRPRRITLKRAWNWGRLVLGVLGLVLVTYYVSEADSLLETFFRVDPLWVFIALLLNLVAMFVKTLRWWLVIRQSKIEMRLQRLFGTYMVGTFFTQFLPGSSVGGDAMRMMEMGADSGRMVVSVSTVLVERAIGLITIFVSASFILLFFPSEALPTSIHLLVHGLTIVGLAGLIVLRLGWFLNGIVRLFNRLHLGKIAEKITLLSKALQGHLGAGRMLFNMVILSFLANAATMTAAYCALLAVSARVGFFAFIPLMSLVVVIELIPISPGALGLREATYVTFLTGILRVSEANSLTTALIVRGISFSLGILGGLVLIARAIETRQNKSGSPDLSDTTDNSEYAILYEDT